MRQTRLFHILAVDRYLHVQTKRKKTAPLPAMHRSPQKEKWPCIVMLPLIVPAQMTTVAADTASFTDKPQLFEMKDRFCGIPETFQTFFGIGGAMTDASAETFYKTA